MTDLATFLAATLAGLGGTFAAGSLRPGLRRRMGLAACLLWIAGWIAVAPTTAARDEEPFHLLSILIGGLLIAFAVILSRLVATPRGNLDVEPSSSPLPERFQEPEPFLLPGVAFAVPGGVGLLFGSEVLVLAFAITAAVTLIVLFLFR